MWKHYRNASNEPMRTNTHDVAAVYAKHLASTFLEWEYSVYDTVEQHRSHGIYRGTEYTAPWEET